MSGFLTDAGTYLVQVVFGFYILAVLLRLLLQVVRADFYNPVSQFLVALTNPPLRPLRRIIPGLFGIDLASVVLLLALKALELFLVFAVKGASYPVSALLWVATTELIKLTLYVFLFGILIRVIMSWFSPYGSRHSTLGELLHSLTEPLLLPARRLIPPIGGLDISPILVLILLQLTIMFIEHLGAALLRHMI